MITKLPDFDRTKHLGDRHIEKMMLGLAIGLLILRLAFGLTVAAHGAQKLFGWFGGSGLAGFAGALEKMSIRPSAPFALLAGLGEFAGGLLIAVGFLSPAGPLMVAGAMVVAIVTVHLKKGFFNSKGGYEFPLLMGVGSVALSITGPGPYSLDGALRVSLPEPGTWIVFALLAAGGVAATLGSRLVGRRGLELG
jgi:putative oxidoreductase